MPEITYFDKLSAKKRSALDQIYISFLTSHPPPPQLCWERFPAYYFFRSFSAKVVKKVCRRHKGLRFPFGHISFITLELTFRHKGLLDLEQKKKANKYQFHHPLIDPRSQRLEGLNLESKPSKENYKAPSSSKGRNKTKKTRKQKSNKKGNG